MGSKFRLGDRVRVNEKLFPSFNEGLFNGLAKTGRIVEVDEGSILPYRAALDGFEHHTFWFYEDQLLFESAQQEAEWAKANQPVVKKAAPTGKPAETTT